MRHLARDAKILVNKGAMKGWIVGIIALAVLVAAGIDGGEEPLRPYDQAIVVPETAR